MYRDWASHPKVAVLVPCYNEEAAISRVVADFRAALGDVPVYVYDNNSCDLTMAEARKAGAIVRKERLQGKGHVVRRMFADLEADVYILVDGDGTYDASMAPAMLQKLCDEQLDMVTGVRSPTNCGAYRRGHRLGNRLPTAIVAHIFGNRISDMLSGYRAFSRRFVKSFPALSGGFEIETEFAVHLPVGEIVTRYKRRPAGSVSKLSTCTDGAAHFAYDSRPDQRGTASAILQPCRCGPARVRPGAGNPHCRRISADPSGPRLPTALLATGLVLLAFLSLASGLILDSVTRGRKEMKRLA